LVLLVATVRMISILPIPSPFLAARTPVGLPVVSVAGSRAGARGRLHVDLVPQRTSMPRTVTTPVAVPSGRASSRQPAPLPRASVTVIAIRRSPVLALAPEERSPAVASVKGPGRTLNTT
jgi:hypothetical protein